MKSFNEWADEFSKTMSEDGGGVGHYDAGNYVPTPKDFSYVSPSKAPVPGATGEEEGPLGPEDVQIAQSLKTVLARFFAQLERNRRMSRGKKMQILELVLNELGLKKRDVAATVRQWNPS